jgi:hypothetical protein
MMPFPLNLLPENCLGLSVKSEVLETLEVISNRKKNSTNLDPPKSPLKRGTFKERFLLKKGVILLTPD